MLRVRPIYGASSHHPASKSISLPPSCILIEYGGLKVLVNVGWDESCGRPPSPSSLFPEDISAILLTDSSLHAVGGVPIFFSPERQVPTYCTFPTLKMGQMTLYDQHANATLDGRDPNYSLSTLDSLFSPTSPHCISTLKYSQTLLLRDPLSNKAVLGITPHRAGHLVGAAYWILKRLSDETEVVVVAGQYHHAKEKHLDSATLYKFGTAADVLVTIVGGPGYKLGELYLRKLLNPPQVGRDQGEFIETILSTLRRNGNVLLPVDASGRVLELLLLLSQYWEKHRLQNAYTLAWVGPMAYNTAEFARSQLEWMASSVGAQFDSQRGHPFSFKGTVVICGSVAELDAMGQQSNPMCVLASGASLDCGPARDLLLRWSENPDNAVILTDSRRCVARGDTTLIFPSVEAADDHNPADLMTSGAQSRLFDSRIALPLAVVTPDATTAAAIVEAEEETEDNLQIGSALSSPISPYSTSAQLLLKWCEAKALQKEMADVIHVDVLVPHRAPLAGGELLNFLAEEEAALAKEKAAEEVRAMLREVELAKGRLRLNEEETAVASTVGVSSVEREDAMTISDRSTNLTATTTQRQPVKRKSRFDANLFLKFSKPCHMTFEVREEAVGVGQSDSVAKYGIGESVGRSGEVLEDDYGISVRPERFVDIVTGVDPSKHMGGSGRIGDEVLRRGLGFGSDGRPILGGLLRGEGDDTNNSKGDDGNDNSNNNKIVNDEQALEAADLSEGKGIIRGRNGRPPIKITTVPRRLEVLAEVAYIPLEGRVDARAARQSVRALQPRQVVILGGGKPPHYVGDDDPEEELNQNEEFQGEAALLADTVRSLTLGKGSIFAPSDGETVELSVGHAAYSVRLIDTPYTTREEKAAVEGDEASPTFEPFEAKMGECTVSVLDCVATGQKVALDGSIVLAPSRQAEQHRRHPYVMLSDGDVLLTDLRSEVTAQGMKAEYSAHSGYSQLVVNGRIVVKKDQGTGKINVEGPLCEDFFAVRSVICAQYVTL